MQTKTVLLLMSVGAMLAAGSNSLAQEVAESQDAAKKNEAGKAEFDALSKQLTNSVFEGHFTMDGQDSAPKREQYFLKKVAKLPTGDFWLIQTRIKYGDHDVTVPLSLPIKWSGKTPVITVDNVTIPGLGTFNARVLIADGKYAGTWQHGDVGGHLYGTIKSEKAAAGDEADNGKEKTENADPSESDDENSQ